MVLSGNKIVDLPFQFSLFSNLAHFSCTHNELENIPIILASLPRLEQLTLTGNKIGTIPDEIIGMTSLKELALDKNNIRVLPQSLIQNTTLEWLVLEENPFLESIPDEILMKENLNLIIHYEDMQQVIPGLYIGSHSYEKRMKNTLKEKGITHILFLVHKSIPSHPEDFVYKKFEIEDSEHQIVSHIFEETNEYITEGIKRGGILVNCECGVSRSATVVLAYLMYSLNVNYDQAYLMLRKKRPVVKPNLGFKRQLIEWKNSFVVEQ